MVKQYAPDQVSESIPEDPVTLVRINGVLQLVGGLALATGKGRRLGALVLAATHHSGHHREASVLDPRRPTRSATPTESHFLKNISLLGGVLLASRDTEGRPSIAYRAQKGGQSLARDTKKASQKIADQSSGAGRGGPGRRCRDRGDRGRHQPEGQEDMPPSSWPSARTRRPSPPSRRRRTAQQAENERQKQAQKDLVVATKAAKKAAEKEGRKNVKRSED